MAGISTRRGRQPVSSLATTSSIHLMLSSSIVVSPSNGSVNANPSMRITRQSVRLKATSSPSSEPKEVEDVSSATIKKKATRKRKTPAKTSAAAASSLLDLANAEDTTAMPSTPKKKTRRSPTSGAVVVKQEEDGAMPVTPDAVEQTSKVSTTSKAKSKRQKAVPKKKKIATLTTTSPPDGWEEVYAIVEELRSDRTAPVDTDGGEKLPQTEFGPETYRFQVLIALMLSSQTKDAMVGEAMRKLQDHGLTVENIAKHTTPEELNAMIRRVGFHNNKTKYIKQTAAILLETYNADIPPTVEGMMALPGVGPKMAYIVENVAWNRVTGIGVDTHMHRLFNILKWVNSKNPEQTRLQLESWLPREKWGSVNLVWVGFGQEAQQFKPKLLQKALDCSRPAFALKLLNKLGLDYKKEGAKLGLEEQIKAALSQKEDDEKKE